METLNSTEPHYIRCVKPNNALKPAIFENSNVIQQLRCGVSILYGDALALYTFVLYLVLFFQNLALPFLLILCGYFIQFRVFLKQLGSAVLDILREEHFMSSSYVLGFLHQKFWMESKLIYRPMEHCSLLSRLKENKGTWERDRTNRSPVFFVHWQFCITTICAAMMTR